MDNRVPYWVYCNRQDNGTMRGSRAAPEVARQRARRGLPPRHGRCCARRGGRSAARGGGGGGGFGGGRGGGPPWDHGLGGCESGFTVPDPGKPDIVWSTCYGNKVTRYDARTAGAVESAPGSTRSIPPPNDAKYRCHWTPPFAIDPFDHNTVYFGCQVIFSTANGGQAWTRDQPGPLDARFHAHRVVGRHRRRQPRPVLRRGGVRDRAVGTAARADLGGHQ